MRQKRRGDNCRVGKLSTALCWCTLAVVQIFGQQRPEGNYARSKRLRFSMTKLGSIVMHISLHPKAGKANPRSNFGIYQFHIVTVAVVVSQLDRKMIVLTSGQILLKSFRSLFG